MGAGPDVFRGIPRSLGHHPRIGGIYRTERARWTAGRPRWVLCSFRGNRVEPVAAGSSTSLRNVVLRVDRRNAAGICLVRTRRVDIRTDTTEAYMFNVDAVRTLLLGMAALLIIIVGIRIICRSNRADYRRGGQDLGQRGDRHRLPCRGRRHLCHRRLRRVGARLPRHRVIGTGLVPVLRTDDVVRRQRALWLGPPGHRWPFDATYVAWASGFGVGVGLRRRRADRRRGPRRGERCGRWVCWLAWSVAWWLTRALMRLVDLDRPLRYWRQAAVGRASGQEVRRRSDLGARRVAVATDRGPEPVKPGWRPHWRRREMVLRPAVAGAARPSRVHRHIGVGPLRTRRAAVELPRRRGPGVAARSGGGRWAALAGRAVKLRVTSRPYPAAAWARSMDEATGANRLPDVAGAVDYDRYLAAWSRRANPRRPCPTTAGWPGSRSGSCGRGSTSAR